MRKLGKHRSTDADTARSLAWLEQRPEVHKIVLGDHRVRSHSHSTGQLEFKRRTDTGVCLTAYTDVGVREIFVYTDQPALLEQLIAGRANGRLRMRPKTVMEEAMARASAVPAVEPSPTRRVLPEFTPAPPAPPAPVQETAMMDVRLMGARVSSEVEYALVEVTPELAFDWLVQRNKVNRAIRNGHVADFVAIIKSGGWNPEAGVIMFDKDGNLLNGQHRLTAIVEAGEPVRVRIAYSVPLETRGDVDTVQLRRTDVDIARMGGDTDVSATHFAAAIRAYLRGRRERTVERAAKRFKLPARQRQALQRLWHEAVSWAVAITHGRSRVFRSAGLAVLARAYYSADRAKVEEFARVVGSGMPTGDAAAQKAAILLRNWLLTGGRKTTEQDLEIYQKTARALRAFLDAEPLARLYAAEEELFPVPEGMEQGEA